MLLKFVCAITSADSRWCNRLNSLSSREGFYAGSRANREPVLLLGSGIKTPHSQPQRLSNTILKGVGRYVHSQHCPPHLHHFGAGLSGSFGSGAEDFSELRSAIQSA